MTAREIAASIRDEVARARDYAVELERIAGILESAAPPAAELGRPAQDLGDQYAAIVAAPAPYGYKADGTPRKRPAPPRQAVERSIATRRLRAEARRAGATPSEVATLHVVTGGTSERELDGREVAYTTEATTG